MNSWTTTHERMCRTVRIFAFGYPGAPIHAPDGAQGKIVEYRETYVCMCDGGFIEYGWTYKAAPDSEDSIRDEPIERTRNHEEAAEWCAANSANSIHAPRRRIGETI